MKQIIKNTYRIAILLLCTCSLKAQSPTKLFNDSRVINSHSVEVLQKGTLDIRIGHRFGDVGGAWNTFYGLEQATDVYIGGEYGLSDKFLVGLSRSKGSAGLRMLVNGLAKWNLAHEKDGKPFSLTLVGLATVSTMQKSDSPSSLSHFPNFLNRMSYCGQWVIGKRISPALSLQANISALHRNIVLIEDMNTTISVGMATRIQLNKTFALIGDINMPLNGPQSFFQESSANLPDFYIPIGVGMEFNTGGHIFQMNLTNARGIPQTDFLASTTSSWLDGGFRLGFTISRVFKVR